MTTGNTPNFAKQPETQHDAELQRSTNREHSSDVEEIIRKEVEVFKWCDEHPDELVKKCLEYEPDLQLCTGCSLVVPCRMCR